MVIYRSALKKSFLIFGMAVLVGSLALLPGCGSGGSTPSKTGDGMSDKEMKNMK
jgi:hypothetical protein